MIEFAHKDRKNWTHERNEFAVVVSRLEDNFYSLKLSISEPPKPACASNDTCDTGICRDKSACQHTDWHPESCIDYAPVEASNSDELIIALKGAMLADPQPEAGPGESDIATTISHLCAQPWKLTIA